MTVQDVALPKGRDIAVVFLGLIATLSALSVSLLLLYIIVTSCVNGRKEKKTSRRVFSKMHDGAALVACLLCSDLVQALGGMIQLYWGHKRHVQAGNLCTAQGAMIMFGDVGTAMWNASVAIHTFWNVVLVKTLPDAVVIALIVGGWCLVFLITILGPLAIQTSQRGDFYGIAAAWCWVTPEYKVERVLLHYLPLLLSAFIITILYILIALRLLNILVVRNDGLGFAMPRMFGTSVFARFNLQRKSSPLLPSQSTSQEQSLGTDDNRQQALGVVREAYNNRLAPRPITPQVLETVQQKQQQSAQRRLALKFLWYPIAYIALIMPMTVARIAPDAPISMNALLVFEGMLFFMGASNTLIYSWTHWRHMKVADIPLPKVPMSAPKEPKSFVPEKKSFEGGGRSVVRVDVDKHIHHDPIPGVLNLTHHPMASYDSASSSETPRPSLQRPAYPRPPYTPPDFSSRY